MNAITLWCSLWNAATYSERDVLFHLGCNVFGAPLMFAAVAALTDVETDAAGGNAADVAAFVSTFVLDIDGYSGGAFGGDAA